MTTPFLPVEEALLKAALLDGPAARAAFVQWQALADLERGQETGQLRMLPLLYANMERLGVADPVMGRLRAVHRHAWAEARRRQNCAATVVRLLAGQDIPVMFTKGVALANGYYPDAALRPMQDVDILVPRERAEAAVATILAAGWRFMEPYPDYIAGGARRAAFMTLNNGLGLRDAHGNEADVHWDGVHECALPFVSEWFWSEAEGFAVAGEQALRLGPGPLLFHVIGHGLRPNPMSPLRWVADAAMILRQRGERIDWDRFWQTADRARMAARLSEGLARVERITGGPLPDGARRAARASAVERLENAAFRKARDGEYPGIAIWLLRAAKMLRLSGGASGGILIRILRQWLNARMT